MRSDSLTVLMYHYVRPTVGSRYPEIRSLDLSDFEGQLDYIKQYYNVVSTADVVASVEGIKTLPDAPLLLSFDDGYADHYRHVFPALKRRNLTGVFFPPACAVLNRRMLDVNKVHFILASTKDTGVLVQHIDTTVELARDEFELGPVTDYHQRLWEGNRFDPAEVIYIKRMLQFALPEALRTRITTELFHRHVSQDEYGFADDLYVTEEHLREMLAGGMEVGSHGYAHYWLDNLSAQEQANDIDRSLDMLGRIGLRQNGFYFCYPYGAYTLETVDILRARGCAAAFTTKVGLCRPELTNMLEIPRLDTNDLPKLAAAMPVSWTKLATHLD